LFSFGAIELIENLEREIRKERWLGTAKILHLSAKIMDNGKTTHIGTVAIENLVVMLNFEDTVLNYTHGEIHPTIDQQTEGHEILCGY